jgi:hypothetical protein
MSSRANPRAPIAPAPVPVASDGSTPLPANPGHDVINVINASGNVSSDDGAQTILDVVPDMRFPLITWIYSIEHAIPASAYNTSPHASPASILGYTIIMFTGLLLFNDLCLRPHPSMEAQQIMNDHVMSMFFELLLDMPVPGFAENEFVANQYFKDPLATNLFVCPDLAGSNFLFDFGRLFPASIFLHLHNLMGSLPANVSPSNLLHMFYSQVVATVNFGTVAQPNNVNVTPSMFFGATVTANAATTRYSNWLNSRVEHLVTGLAIRPVFTAPTIGLLPIRTPAIADNNVFNAYTFLTGFRHSNVNSLLQFVRSLGQFVKQTFPNSRPLRNYTQAGSEDAVAHLIFKATIPTWTTSPGLAALAANAASTVFVPGTAPQSHDEFANDTNFFVTRPDVTTAPDGTNNFVNAVRTRAEANAPAQPWWIQVTENAAPPANTADPVPWLTNSETNSLSVPRCLIFCPITAVVNSTARTILSGHVIEINDTSAVFVPLSRPDMPLHTTNATLISGAVPISLLPSALNNAHSRYIENVPVFSHLTIPQGLFRGAFSQVRIPYMRQGVVELLGRALSGYHNFFNGAIHASHTRRPADVWNVFALALGTDTAISPDNITFWSSYRYFDEQSQRWMAIPTLRPIFGTRARHFGSEHPSIRIP